jgi:hypothetical protein
MEESQLLSIPEEIKLIQRQAPFLTGWNIRNGNSKDASDNIFSPLTAAEIKDPNFAFEINSF